MIYSNWVYGKSNDWNESATEKQYDSTVLATGGRADNFLVGDLRECVRNAGEGRSKRGVPSDFARERVRWSA